MATAKKNGCEFCNGGDKLGQKIIDAGGELTCPYCGKEWAGGNSKTALVKELAESDLFEVLGINPDLEELQLMTQADLRTLKQLYAETEEITARAARDNRARAAAILAGAMAAAGV